MFNLPNLNFLQSPEWQQYIQGAMAGDSGLTPPWMGGGAGGITKPVPTNSYKVDGSKYTGPFANQDVNPFRTVEGGRQYGAGLNASAGQLYDHFHRKVGLDKLAGNMDTSVQSYGLSQAGLGQSLQDFLNRRNPQTTPVQPPGANPPPPNPNTNTSYPSFGGGFGSFNPMLAMRNMPTMQSFDKMAPDPNGGRMMSRPTASYSPQQAMFDRNNIFGSLTNMASNFAPPAPRPAPTPPRGI